MVSTGDESKKEYNNAKLESTQEDKTNQETSNAKAKDLSSNSSNNNEEPVARSSKTFSISLLHKRIDGASKGYEEILRIIHSTNLKNAVLVKKNFYEIELICKNALLELKGV
ncbi:MAG TPA: hypothetical protein HPP56_01230 [Nitrospirae bacterium]|nr:hypothetical protein [Nitrospirota bacterium]